MASDCRTISELAIMGIISFAPYLVQSSGLKGGGKSLRKATYIKRVATLLAERFTGSKERKARAVDRLDQLRGLATFMMKDP